MFSDKQQNIKKPNVHNFSSHHKNDPNDIKGWQKEMKTGAPNKVCPNDLTAVSTPKGQSARGEQRATKTASQEEHNQNTKIEKRKTGDRDTCKAS